ncbi:hypothetical protein [Algicola sagamiensis]|uniref:hypothetical protein n=1 Tax=Algicola sagamiensis TaxID=163869 RepID=UPI00037BFE82|nr:hypothetical protein [Algicola sagamiensis]
MDSFINAIFSFPVAVFSVPFIVFFGLMLLDLIFSFSDSFSTDADVDVDVDSDISWSGKLLLPPIVAQLPFPVLFTATSFFGTVITFYLNDFIFSQLSGVLFYVAAAAGILFTFYISLLASAFALKPLEPLLCPQSFAAIDFQGMNAQVRSATVTETHGEVVITRDGNEIQLDVYSEPGVQFEYGDEVTIIAKNDDSNRYLVSKI